MMAGKFRIKKGDMVMVIAGKERGKTGKVLEVLTKGERIIVEKLNLMKRHTKPNAKNKQGGILEREGSLAISNVMPYCDSVQKPSRVRMKIFEDGRKVRIYQKAPTEVLDKS
ncbi:MAG: 50S ribosomal protein L24 [Nitrospirota bacterium]|nr:MAG: 50S ribosomal protein L24 [Nitrospirota bacterium]